MALAAERLRIPHSFLLLFIALLSISVIANATQVIADMKASDVAKMEITGGVGVDQTLEFTTAALRPHEALSDTVTFAAYSDISSFSLPSSSSTWLFESTALNFDQLPTPIQGSISIIALKDNTEIASVPISCGRTPIGYQILCAKRFLRKAHHHPLLR